MTAALSASAATLAPIPTRTENEMPTPMLIFSKPVAGLLLVAAAAGAYGYERLSPDSPSRPETRIPGGAETAGASRRGDCRADRAAGGRSARAHVARRAGRLRGLAHQDLSRMLEAGAAASRRRSLRRPGAPGLQSGRLARQAARSWSTRRQIPLSSRRPRASWPRCRIATRFRCRPNIGRFMSNGEPRLSTSIRKSPADDAARRTVVALPRDRPMNVSCFVSRRVRSRGHCARRGRARRRRPPAPRATSTSTRARTSNP